MKNSYRLSCLTIILLIFASALGFGQSERTIGILPFDNNGSSQQSWAARGFEEILYDKFHAIKAVTVFERETLARVLKKSGIQSSKAVDPKTAFSIGKATCIEVLILGDYEVKNSQLVSNYRMVSTYTGSPIFEETFTGPLEDIFSYLENMIKKGMGIMQVPIHPLEEIVLAQKHTKSIAAFKSYCNAYLEIAKGSPTEVVASYFQRALQEDPEFWEARYNLGVIYYNFRLYDKSLEQFETVINQNPKYFKAYYGKGVIHFLDRHYQTALNEFKTTLTYNPDHDRSHYYIGIIYTRTDSLKKGIQSLEKSIEINPHYAPAHYQLGKAQMRRGWFKKAITALTQATRLNPEYHLANNALGEAYYALNLYEEAIIEFNKAIKLKPTFATAHFNLGNAIYRRGALAEIVDAFWSLLEVQYPENDGTNGDHENPLSGLEALREKSRIEDSDIILRNMIKAYRTALSYDNRFYEASYNLALTYENLAKIDSAEYFYKKAISQKFDLSQAHMRLGKIYESQRKFDLSLAEYKEVVRIEPIYFAANPKLGEEFRYINVIETVLNETFTLLEKDPRDKKALEIIGKIYLSLGHYGQAEEYYQQIVDLSPNDALAQQTLQRIRRQLRKL